MGLTPSETCYPSGLSLRPDKLSSQVTQDPRVVLPLQWEELLESESVDLQLVFNSMTKQIQNLLVQRDSFLEVAHLNATLYPTGE